MNHRTIWITEFSPKDGINLVGGWDWFLSMEAALAKFKENYKVLAKTHDFAFYSVTVPDGWSQSQIQCWCEDNTNIIPLAI